MDGRLSAGPELWRGKRSQGAVLIGMCDRVELWHDRSGEPYATVRAADGVVHLEVQTAAFRQWLARGYYEQCGGAPTSGALGDAVAYAAAKATFGPDARDVFLRVGRDAADILVDTCDGAGTVVRVGAGRVTVERDCGVAFRRPRGAGSLPVPVADAELSSLRRFVNVADDDWPLVAGWLVAAMRPVGPYPVLFLHGEQGSGKSTQARVLRSLVDPNFAALRAAPRDAQDLAVSAHNNWVVALDNLSAVPVWLSDALCRLATGGGFATRALYANDRETVFDVERPVLVTGIDDLATRGDLVDRAVIVHLPVISDERRRAESDLWREFNELRPALFGALCRAVALALAEGPATPVGPLPRLADFASWAAAEAPAFGRTPAEFTAIYRRGAAEHCVAAVEASALARPIVRLALAGDWRGTASDLLEAVETHAGRSGSRAAGWPRSLPQFAGCVRRLAPSLRAIGVSVTFEREATTGRRLIGVVASDPALATSRAMPLRGDVAAAQPGAIDPPAQDPGRA